MLFTEMQSRQLYVVKSVVTGENEVTNSSASGAIKLKTSPDGELYFITKGATEDGVQRTALINKKNISYINATAAEDMVHKMHKKEVVLDSNVNGGNPVVGQDYVLTVEVSNYIANGDDSTLIKFGAARAFTTDADALYKALAINLAKNFSRCAVPLIKITLKGDENNTEIKPNTKVSDLSSITATGIVIEEVEQPWRLGVAEQEFVNFKLIPSTIYTNGMDLIWGTVTDLTDSNTNTLPNSKKVADMEYFFHKNRGDIYGGGESVPDTILTKYMIDPSNANGYSMLDIHFYSVGQSMSTGHSPKTVTLVGTKANLTTLVTALETALANTGVTVKKSASWS
jgi:hypothetical protein